MSNQCIHINCLLPVKVKLRELCMNHYIQARNRGEFKTVARTKPCEIENCNRLKHSKQYTCEHCKTSGLLRHKIHWANISRQYKRDKTDWMRLCAKCHKAYDTYKLTLTEMRG